MKDLLELTDVWANIGQFQILQGVSLAVKERRTTVLLGRNGAGKTTTLRTILGYVQAHRGGITLAGTSLRGLQPYQVCRQGIGYLPEDGHVFANLTVRENLEMSVRRPDALFSQRVGEALDVFPDLREAWKRPAGTLSGGQKQMLAMASLMVGDQPLLVIDEPSKGLSPAFVRRLAEVLNLLKERKTILLVEQNVQLAGMVADDFVIVDDGRTVLSGEMKQLSARTDWQQQYLGVDVRAGGDR